MTSRRLEAEKEVTSRTTYSRATLYREIKAGRFPAPVYISPRRKAWDARLVDQWIAQRLGEEV